MRTTQGFDLSGRLAECIPPEGPRWSFAALAALFIAIQSIVVSNAIRHDPQVQYDSDNHMVNIRAYGKGHFPTRRMSHEFFSAPLPYAVPALIARTEAGTMGHGLHAGQWVNVSASVVACLLLVIAATRMGGTVAAAGALLLLGMLPVYYRTMAYVRGEALIPALGLATMVLAIDVFQRHDLRRRKVIALGLAMGLVALARQWGIMILLAAGVIAGVCWLRTQGQRLQLFRAGIISAAVGLAVCGWFYGHLIRETGSATAFNLDPQPTLSLANRPAGFFTGSGNGRLFSQPFRHAFDQQFFPEFYADIWGDYWGYFLIYGRDSRTGQLYHGHSIRRVVDSPDQPWIESNHSTLPRFLGRINRLALFPSLFMLVAFVWGLKQSGAYLSGRRDSLSGAWYLGSSLVIIFSFTFFLWFLLMFRTSEASGVKATYMLQIFPFLALLGGNLLARIRRASPLACILILLVLLTVWLHNLPAYFTRFVRL
ncbi:MAG: DUF2142 domain-containing protein [Verrucomicrobia bacterium]|nr:DUF2142 domain-containing protein [Verrucomicrobiota bacterium]